MSRRPLRFGVALAGALLAISAAAPHARAGAFEVTGLGPAGIAEAGARAARATDGSASFFNPGALAMGRGVHVDLAPQLSVSSLSVQGKTVDLSDPFGLTITADATIPFERFLADRIRLGIALYLPPTAVHFIVLPPDEPQFPYFANRTQRLLAMPSLAVRVTQALGVGVGLNVLGGVEGPADVRPGASGAPEPRIAVDATTRIGVHVGARFDVSEHVHLAAAYRQQFTVPVFVVTKADIGGITLSADAELRQAMFDPHTFVLGAAFDLDRLEVEVDASYSAWSAYKGPALGVRAQLPGVLLTSEDRGDLFRDVVALRGAASYGLDVGRSSEVVLRAGLGVEPSILSGAPQGTFNFADGFKVFSGLGGELLLRDVLPKTVRVGVGLGVTGVLDRTARKRTCSSLPCRPGSVAGPDPEDPSAGITNPGYPELVSGGALWSGSIGLGVDL